MRALNRPIVACQRCRLRKTRCDSNLPKCRSCERANAPCLTTDPAGRSMPRSYLSHLEARVAELEDELDDLKSRQTKRAKTKGGTDSGVVKLEPETTETESISRGYLGESSGLTFTRILNAALREQLGINSLRDDLLPTTPVKRRTFSISDNIVMPPKKVAEQYLTVFFRSANSQLPILHREEFVERYFEPIYGHLSTTAALASEHTTLSITLKDEDPPEGSFYRRCAEAGKFLTPAEDEKISLYFLYQVFAISVATQQQHHESELAETLHLTAMTFQRSVRQNAEDRLEYLQATLMHALYSVMRPAAPGIWYVIGKAMRICEELGLHNEERYRANGPHSSMDEILITDKRRRLFWCAYSLDRQICVYLGRPLGIPDHSIRTPFPSLLDDSVLRPQQHTKLPHLGSKPIGPSYKLVSKAFFEMRRLQGQIQTIGYDHADLPRHANTYQEWRMGMHRALDTWIATAPRDGKTTNCTFNPNYMYLNYHQARLLLFGVSPSNPRPSSDDMMIIAHAGLQIIKIYSELASAKDLNYSWAAVHNLFMAGTSYLYVLYHNQLFREKTSMNELETVAISALEVMRELEKYCSAATSCHESFKLLSQAVIELVQREKLNPNISTLTDESDDFDSGVENFLLSAASMPMDQQGQPNSTANTNGTSSETPGELATPADITDGYLSGIDDNLAGTGLGAYFAGEPDVSPASDVYGYMNEMSRSMIWDSFMHEGGKQDFRE